MLALLAAMVALGPLSVDMYLPAMPAMMKALGTDIPQMHLTLSAYLGGFALFHLACGPLADRFGRKPVLLGGMLLFVLACLGCSRASRVEELLVFRFLQGVGACVGPTLGRTIARDLFGPTGAARALSLVAMMMALAPAVAPALGGLMLLVYPWQTIFYFLAVYGVAVTLLIHRLLPESLPGPQSLHPLAIARNYLTLGVNSLYLSASVASALMYAGLITYLSSSSFVYIEMLGVPVELFGLIFLTTVIGYVTGSALSARLSTTWLSARVMLLGACLALLATGLMLVAHLLLPASVLALALPSALYTAALGLVLPHAMAISLHHFTRIAGTASALFGFLQMTLSSLASALTGQLLHDTPLPMLGMMIGLSALSLALTLYVRRRETQGPAGRGRD
jgi:DHA1 family bicyclomycin/chloramphenicol resistance-like MFS transporter